MASSLSALAPLRRGHAFRGPVPGATAYARIGDPWIPPCRRGAWDLPACGAPWSHPRGLSRRATRRLSWHLAAGDRRQHGADIHERPAGSDHIHRPRRRHTSWRPVALIASRIGIHHATVATQNAVERQRRRVDHAGVRPRGHATVRTGREIPHILPPHYPYPKKPNTGGWRSLPVCVEPGL